MLQPCRVAQSTTKYLVYAICILFVRSMFDHTDRAHIRISCGRVRYMIVIVLLDFKNTDSLGAIMF
jgi:hypothetical protein